MWFDVAIAPSELISLLSTLYTVEDVHAWPPIAWTLCTWPSLLTAARKFTRQQARCKLNL